jgi:hypothetical protein
MLATGLLSLNVSTKVGKGPALNLLVLFSYRFGRWREPGRDTYNPSADEDTHLEA